MMKTLLAPKPAAGVDVGLPKLSLSDYAPYKAAVEKLGAVQNRMTEAQRRCDALLGDQNARRNPIGDAAAAILRGDAPDARSALAQGAATIADATLAEAHRDLQIWREVVEKQKAEVERQHSAASRHVIQEHNLRKRYETIVQSVAVRLRALTEACQQEAAFRDALLDADVIFTGEIPPANVSGLDLGHEDDCNSRVALWVRETRELGYRV